MKHFARVLILIFLRLELVVTKFVQEISLTYLSLAKRDQVYVLAWYLLEFSMINGLTFSKYFYQFWITKSLSNFYL